MKEERHKRKEYYSILVVSNINRASRQYHIARRSVKWLCCIGLVLCVAIAGVIGYTVTGSKEAKRLQKELDVQISRAETLEMEKKKLSSEKEELETEIAALHKESDKGMAEAEASEETEGAEADPALPVLYPSSGVGSLTATYSEEHPYISIGTYSGGEIIAAGDGIVTAIGSDDTYKYIIEIEHEGGYKTRYFYSQTAELKTEEGSPVKGGDVLLTVSEDGIDLDYQVLQNEEPIDPFLIIDAEG